MYKKAVFIIFLFLLFVLNSYGHNYTVIAHSPVDNAEYTLLNSNIFFTIYSQGIPLRTGNISIDVKGTLSNNISGNLKVLKDGVTLIFDPVNNFTLRESVSVKLYEVQGSIITDTLAEFSFKVQERTLNENLRPDIMRKILKDEFPGYGMKKRKPLYTFSDTIPETFPEIEVSVFTQPSAGRLFCVNLSRVDSVSNYLIILENDGTPVFYRKVEEMAYDFKVQETGLLTYFDSKRDKFYGMDSSYNIVDSFYTGNGYITDIHELRLLPNGHALLMSYDSQLIDMSLIYPGGHKDATVVGLVIQEIDDEKNVVFQWRSWDHLGLFDAPHINYSSTAIDYVHGNAIEVDYDNNLLISSRNFSEIIKIHRVTGEVIWELGNNKNNDFTFINDPIGFSYQHAIRRTANGTYTLYDNGNFHDPSFSRAVEYLIDETNRTAELIWEYRSDPLIYGPAMGFVKRLPDGNTSISWGSTVQTYTEVNPAGQKVYEFNFEVGNTSYRVVKEDWDTDNLEVPAGIPDQFTLLQNYPNPFNGSTKIIFGLNTDTKVSLKIFDVLGREIKTLVNNSVINAGYHSINVNASTLTSGVYYYSLISGNQIISKKLVLVK